MAVQMGDTIAHCRDNLSCFDDCIGDGIEKDWGVEVSEFILWSYFHTRKDGL